MLTNTITALLQDKKRARNPYVLRNNSTTIKDDQKRFESGFLDKKKLIFQLPLCTLYLIICSVLLFNFRNKSGKLILIYSLTFNQIYREGSCQSLREFFLDKKFGLDRESNFLIECKSLKLKKSFKRFKVTRDISLQVYSNYSSFSEKIYIFLQIVRRFIYSFILLIRVKDFVLVMKEYIFDESIFWKKREKLIEKVITTQTHLFVQPLIFRLDISREKRIMIWYSANSFPIKYKDKSQLVLGLSNDFYSNIQVDEHWVWNRSNAAYIGKLTSKKTVIKGTMLFYGPSLKQNTSAKVDVLLFDVTPTSSMSENNILNERYVSSFITEIVQTVEELKGYPPLKIGLKPKRETVNFHSKIYLEMLEQYFSSGRITKIDHKENIYDLILNAKVVLAFPFTSPILVAKELGVACAFYSSSDLLESQNSYYGIKFIDNQFALRQFLVRNVLRIS